MYPVERDALPAWIAARLTRQRQRASRETLAFLADRCEGNLLAARQEIEKLALLLPEGELDARRGRGARSPTSRATTSSSCRKRGWPATRRARCASCASLQAEGDAPIARDLAARRGRARDRRRARAWCATGTPVSAAVRNARVWGKRQAALERAVNRVAPASVAVAAAARSPGSTRCPRDRGRGDAWDALADVALALCGKPIVRRGLKRACNRSTPEVTMYRKILVAYDGSPESRLASSECIRLAPGPATEVHLAGVVHDPSLYVLVGEYVPEIALDDDQARVDADLKEAAAAARSAAAWPSPGTCSSGNRSSSSPGWWRRSASTS